MSSSIPTSSSSPSVSSQNHISALSSNELSFSDSPIQNTSQPSILGPHPNSVSNHHPMQTIFKCGVFKPKAYQVDLNIQEPLTID